VELRTAEFQTNYVRKKPFCNHLHTLFQHNLGNLVAERYQITIGTILDFNEARVDRVAVASAGPYANHLH